MLFRRDSILTNFHEIFQSVETAAAQQFHAITDRNTGTIYFEKELQIFSISKISKKKLQLINFLIFILFEN